MLRALLLIALLSSSALAVTNPFSDPKSEHTFKRDPHLLKSSEKNICTGGVDPSSLSLKAYLAAFAAGPCAPTMVLPGLVGSRLRIIIDCEVLKSTDPATFAACGWTSCGSGTTKSPKREYDGWIPRPLSPNSILTTDKNDKKCFSGLIKPNYGTFGAMTYHY